MRDTPPAAEAPAQLATNVTLPEPLPSEAHALGIDLSQAAERGLRAAVTEQRAERWVRENQAGMDAWNAYVEEHGLPLAEYRSC